ncbi:Protein of unknown function [Pyronema omphalodes CBS 100304]|uniref:Uncharacterized protein n=1 Tax=Pyronema omphalodes (strain CBS 100304) TaxID=1076935 RepID=U4KWL3_PYROM|nr:Protein of unknown function [Pyronema omphalodes CBS 100304]
MVTRKRAGKKEQEQKQRYKSYNGKQGKCRIEYPHI